MPVYVPVPVRIGPTYPEKVNQNAGFEENTY